MKTKKLTGRLELTWTNKHLRLLAHEDGSYEWVEPSDHRVAEVRLLRDAGQVGAEGLPALENLLIRGDALHALLSIGRLPEYSAYLGAARLIYIDPPFNTKQSFMQYDDALEHSVWLTMMRDRLLQARSLLAEDGSIWVHLDDSEMAYARVVLDEVFGRENFVATVIWEKTHTRENRTDISVSHDYIHVYARNRSLWKTRRNLLNASEAQLDRYANPDNDPRGPWASLPAHAKAERGRRAEQFYEITTPSGRQLNPPRGRCWLYTRERFNEMVADQRIWFGRSGNNAPRVKKFLSEVQTGLVPTSIWSHEEVGTTAVAKGEIVALFPGQQPFSTPKPESLMERIIHIATNPGDLVVDFFAGSGTTAAVAHKMGRRWLTSERSEETVANYTLPRLKKIVEGTDAGGVTSKHNWNGGGSFNVLDVAPSMFEEVDGVVLLSDWAVDRDLAEATAAQLGFTFDSAASPFSGWKGRCRLAVIDGRVDANVVSMLAELLAKGETMIVCATSVDPAAHDAAPSGSSVQKIPSSILQQYRRTYRSRRRQELGMDAPALTQPQEINA